MCAIFSYIFFKKITLGFTDKKGNDVELTEEKINHIKFGMSVLWIYFLPYLVIDYVKRKRGGKY